MREPSESRQSHSRYKEKPDRNAVRLTSRAPISAAVTWYTLDDRSVYYMRSVQTGAVGYVWDRLCEALDWLIHLHHRPEPWVVADRGEVGVVPHPPPIRISELERLL